MAASPKLTLYSSVASQWANVPHLGLAEKGFRPEDVEIKEIDLIGAENFSPSYVSINPNGTIPSLTHSSLPRPLIDTREILEYLDASGPGRALVPTDPETAARTAELIALVHGDAVSTNLILLQPRDLDEYNAKKNSGFAQFLANRQAALVTHSANSPSSEFYRNRKEANGALNAYYTSSPSADGKHEAFFQSTREGYEAYAKEFDRLESLLVLPYAAGPDLTTADLHIIPWLAHAQMGVGTTDILDLDTLEKHFQKSVPGFAIGPKTREWWAKVNERDSVKKIYAGKPR